MVCGRGETMAIFSPSTRLSRVDLPTLGRPRMATNPARYGSVFGVRFSTQGCAPRVMVTFSSFVLPLPPRAIFGTSSNPFTTSPKMV